MNLLRLGLFACGIANRHAFEDRRIQHDAPNAVSAHDQAGCLLILLSIGHLDVNFEGANSSLPPFSIRELEQLSLASKVCLLFFLARFNYWERNFQSVGIRAKVQPWVLTRPLKKSLICFVLFKFTGASVLLLLSFVLLVVLLLSSPKRLVLTGTTEDARSTWRSKTCETSCRSSGPETATEPRKAGTQSRKS